MIMEKAMASNRLEQKVLFLVHQYEPNPKPCEVCIMRVQESLLKLGVKSDVLEYNGPEGLVKKTACGNVYSTGAAKPRVDTTKKNIVLDYLKKIPILFRWPYLFNKAKRAIYKSQVDFLISKNHYSAIIGATLPVDTATVAAEYDHFIHYELDAVANNPEYKRGIKKLYRGKLNRIERYLYEKAELIIHMEFNRRYLAKYDGSKYHEKFVFSDIPNLVEPQNLGKKSSHYNDGRIKFAYFGALVRDYRNPGYLIKVLNELDKVLPVQCEFFSRGNCEDILAEAANSSPNVFLQRGYVDQRTVAEKQAEADVLVSIGNQLTGTDYSLPSKIIEYIAMGKPILHTYGGSNDSVIGYLDKYELGCVIYPEDDLKETVNKICDFIGSTKGKRIPFEQVKQIFYHNSPDFTAEIIKEFIDRG